MHHEYTYSLPPPALAGPKPTYPWETSYIGTLPRITKEFFRCKGNPLNPVRIVKEAEGLVRYYDCGGVEKHSLPLNNGKEFIYPILIELLNYLQVKTNKRVVITSGHRCPEHHAYTDPRPSSRNSKHLMGAEVSFYVQGLEDRPEEVVQELKRYYQQEPKYKEQKEFTEFLCYEKEDTQTMTRPLYNKEIFIKLYKATEGRNFDNRHPYPYISIQVRYDTATQKKVVFDAQQAFRNYLRH